MTPQELLDALQNQRVEDAAPLLLGARLHTPLAIVQIVEVEAYAGTDDPGSHAYTRQTSKNATMYGPPGHAYVYISYGLHHMLNIVAHPDQNPAAILIRAAKPLTDPTALYTNRPKATKPHQLLSGPGKLCQALQITKQQNALNVLEPNPILQLEPSPSSIAPIIAKRVGLAPGKGDQTLWRFIDPDQLKWISPPKPKLTPAKP